MRGRRWLLSNDPKGVDWRCPEKALVVVVVVVAWHQFLKAEVQLIEGRDGINAAVTFGTHRLAHQSLCVNGLAVMAGPPATARGPGPSINHCGSVA